MADEIDELYALPLGDFTRARNDLEKRLRKEGHRDQAAEVKALRKPTVPAWALNQVARRHKKEVARLIEAGRRVSSAQEKLLGGGDRKALDKASTDQRELSRKLVRAAVTIGDEAGTATGAAFEDKVGATLRAAAADDEVAAQLAAGRLEREQEAVGLLGFGSVPEAKPKRRRRPRTTTTRPARPRPASAGPRPGSESACGRSRRRRRPRRGRARRRRPPRRPPPRNAGQPSGRWSA